MFNKNSTGEILRRIAMDAPVRICAKLLCRSRNARPASHSNGESPIPKAVLLNHDDFIPWKRGVFL